MTRKHYVALATALARNRPDGNVYGLVLWNAMIEDISDVLKRDNPRFDRNKFYAACESR